MSDKKSKSNFFGGLTRKEVEQLLDGKEIVKDGKKAKLEASYFLDLMVTDLETKQDNFNKEFTTK